MLGGLLTYIPDEAEEGVPQKNGAESTWVTWVTGISPFSVENKYIFILGSFSSQLCLFTRVYALEIHKTKNTNPNFIILYNNTPFLSNVSLGRWFVPQQNSRIQEPQPTPPP